MKDSVYKLLITVGVIAAIVVVFVLMGSRKTPNYHDKYDGMDLTVSVAGAERQGTYSGYLRDHAGAAEPKTDVDVDIWNYQAESGVEVKNNYENESKAKKELLEQQRARVKTLEASVDPALMAEYLSIKKHTTPPVVRLQFGQCSGCNTSLPSAILSKIKNGVLVECETCGRMIIQ